MIVKKTWYSKRTIKQFDDKTGERLLDQYGVYHWTGYFLFGIIPLYLSRQTWK